MNREYVIEFYVLSRFNNQYYLDRYFCDTKTDIDGLIEKGKQENKKHLRTTDNLKVYVKNSDLEVIDAFTFELQEL